MPLKFLKKTGILVLIPILISALALLLMAGAYLLPTEPMKAHVRSTLDTFEKEGQYPFVNDEQGSMRDNFIDALNLCQDLVGTDDADLLSCVVKNPYYSGPDTAAPIDNLKAAVTDPESVTLVNTEYRFFNAHVIFQKALLLVMGYPGIRLFCFYLCLLGTAWMGFLMYKRKLGKYIAPFMLSILFLRPYTVWTNMSFTLIYIPMLLPCIAMLLLKKETVEEKGWLLFGITGSVTQCLVQNYFQLMSFGMPLMMYFLVTGLPEKPLKTLKTVLDLFAAWAVGYAGTMACNWAAYSLVTGDNIFGEMIHHALWRTNEEKGSRLETVAYNARIAFGDIWWNLIEAGFLGWTAFRRIKARSKISLTVPALLLLAFSVLFAVGRLALFSNHSMVHAPFTYRVFLMPVLALNLWVTGRRRQCAPALTSV